jgi:hypothetical protein
MFKESATGVVMDASQQKLGGCNDSALKGRP